MKCPFCSNAMKEENYEGVIIDRCCSCDGVWLDDNEIQIILQQTQKTFTELQKIEAIILKNQDHREKESLRCPKCGDLLQVLNYALNSGVFIDRCKNHHGVWLDKGELDKLQIFMEEKDLRSGKHDKQKQQNNFKSKKVCPRDGTALNEVTYEDQIIDQCNKCGGLWCDFDELSKIIASRENIFSDSAYKDIIASESNKKISQEKDLIVSLDCVICGKPMPRLNYSYSSGIIIDRCPDDHGVWLDKDELDRIQVFVERWGKNSKETEQKYSSLLTIAAKEAESRYQNAVNEGIRSVFFKKRKKSSR